MGRPPARSAARRRVEVEAKRLSVAAEQERDRFGGVGGAAAADADDASAPLARRARPPHDVASGVCGSTPSRYRREPVAQAAARPRHDRPPATVLPHTTSARSPTPATSSPSRAVPPRSKCSVLGQARRTTGSAATFSIQRRVSRLDERRATFGFPALRIQVHPVAEADAVLRIAEADRAAGALMAEGAGIGTHVATGGELRTTPTA